MTHSVKRRPVDVEALMAERQEGRAAIQAAYDAAGSIRAYGESIGVTYTAARDKLRRYGVKLRPRGGELGRKQVRKSSTRVSHVAVMDAAERERIQAEYDAAGSISAYGELFGVTYSVARRILIHAGIQLRGRGGTNRTPANKLSEPEYRKRRTELAAALNRYGSITAYARAERITYSTAYNRLYNVGLVGKKWKVEA